MKLIVFYPIVCIKEIGCASIKLWVPPLSFMKRRADIKWIIHTRWDFNLATKLYKLFNPVKEYSRAKYHYYISPIWLMKKNCIKDDVEICQSKEISPSKLEGFLYFSKGRLQMFHGFFLPICNQHSISFIKNTINFIDLDKWHSLHIRRNKTIHSMWRQHQGISYDEL